MGKYWNMASVSDTDGEITLYGDVLDRTPTDWWTGEPEPGLFITPEGFMEDLEAVKDKQNITVKINSCGGDVYTGIAIHNALVGLNKPITVLVEGIAASAASIIACAGSTVKMYPGSLMMIHGVSGFFAAPLNLQDLKREARSFDAIERAIADIYHQKTGIPVDTLRGMMEKEKWMTGKEAVEKGFADEIVADSPEAEISLSGNLLIVNGISHDVAGLTLPEGIPVIPKAPKQAARKPAEKGRKQPMTLEELKNQCPELLEQYREELTASIAAQVKTQAVSGERKRLQDIESIEAGIQDKELIQQAKYGDNPMNAADLALLAMQKQAALGVQHLEAWTRDITDSGAQQVQPTGQGTEKSEEELGRELIAQTVNNFKKMKGVC